MPKGFRLVVCSRQIVAAMAVPSGDGMGPLRRNDILANFGDMGEKLTWCRLCSGFWRFESAVLDRGQRCRSNLIWDRLYRTGCSISAMGWESTGKERFRLNADLLLPDDAELAVGLRNADGIVISIIRKVSKVLGIGRWTWASSRGFCAQLNCRGLPPKNESRGFRRNRLEHKIRNKQGFDGDRWRDGGG
ncbi:hypothetical protein DFH09DRAFT_1098273 [Mycena vulgaris]|nr:hypothetical protein DFH09DRAFT_1098273 [Mycena vulgaris]